jgi:hypothetical protein
MANLTVAGVPNISSNTSLASKTSNALVGGVNSTLGGIGSKIGTNINQNTSTLGGAINPISATNTFSGVSNLSSQLVPTTTKTPTAVVTSKINPASDGTISNIISEAKTKTETPQYYDMQTGELTSAGKAAGMTPMLGGKTITTTPTVTAPQVEKTAEQAQLDEINHPGQEQQYSTTTGQQEWVEPGTPGYTTVNPNQVGKSYVSEADAGTGTTIRQLPDGSYVRWNSTSDSYAGAATAGQFNLAKAAQNAQKQLQDLKNGILNPLQRSQVDGINAQLAKDIAKMELYNANVTGANTIAQNMYGMGTNAIGQGVITKTI